MSACPICGYNHDTTACPAYFQQPSPFVPTQYYTPVGWQCPLCGVVNAPFRQECVNIHGPKSVTVSPAPLPATPPEGQK